MKLIHEDSRKQRLDAFLRNTHPEFSRSQIQKYLKSQVITVNGKEASVHHWLRAGDVIEGPDLAVEKKEQTRTVLSDPIIIHREEDFVVVQKPAGLLTHPTEQNEPQTLVGWLIKNFPAIAKIGDDPMRPGIVHRLDKDVGGLMVAALSQDMFDHLKAQFKDHTIIKKYRCLVYGAMLQDEGVIDMPIERSREKRRMVVQSGRLSGKPARTTYEVLQKIQNYTLLDVQILTGRTHQIRAHFHSIGHSIVGDQLYQTRDVRRRNVAQKILDRPFLFAYYLAFTDMAGQTKEFTVELPGDLKQVLHTLSS